MSPAELVNAALLALLVAVGAPLLVARLNRIEDMLATRAGKDELEALRRELRGEIQTRAGKDELEALREEVGELRRELRADAAAARADMAAMRSKLTQVALAVGANRPKPAEG